MNKKVFYWIAMYAQFAWALIDQKHFTPEFMLLMLILDIMIDTEVE